MKILVLTGLISILYGVREISTFENGKEHSQKSKARSLVEELSKKYNSTKIPTWDRYLTFNEINDFIDFLGEVHSDTVTVHVAGFSSEGRPIKIVEIHSGKPNANTVWIDGGIHGREWVTPMAVLLIICQLAGMRQNPEEVGVNFYINPIMNPDGYEYSRKFSKYWRKNRRMVEEDCMGVDLNRNWIYQPKYRGLHEKRCTDLYPGPFPFSEPETQAIRTFLKQNSKNMKAFLTFHTFGQMIMYPYGYKAELPKDHADLERLGNDIVQNIKTSGGPQYKVVNTYNHSGFSAGGLDDYAKEVLRVKYTYTVELRDEGFYMFHLPSSLILPTAMDALIVADTVVGEVAGIWNVEFVH